MKQISLKLPDDAIVRGALYDTMDPLFLVQDILDVVLPDGVIIDVGWYPESDPSGEYRITVYQDTWQNKLLAQPIRVHDANSVAAEVSRLAFQHSRQVVAVTAESDDVGTD